MKRTSTIIRCVPRYGYDFTEVREVALDVPNEHDDRELRLALTAWFEAQGVREAVFDIDVDGNGYFAVINDEAYEHSWGKSVF